MLKTKSLIKKFSFGELQTTCKREGWRIPSIEEVKKFEECAYDLFWVSELPIHKDDIETHAILYEKSTDRKYIVNKNHLQQSVVIVDVKKCKWKFDDNDYIHYTGCDKLFSFTEEGVSENEFIFCPYCGSQIEEV